MASGTCRAAMNYTLQETKDLSPAPALQRSQQDDFSVSRFHTGLAYHTDPPRKDRDPKADFLPGECCGRATYYWHPQEPKAAVPASPPDSTTCLFVAAFFPTSPETFLAGPSGSFLRALRIVSPVDAHTLAEEDAAIVVRAPFATAPVCLFAQYFGMAAGSYPEAE